MLIYMLSRKPRDSLIDIRDSNSTIFQNTRVFPITSNRLINSISIINVKVTLLTTSWIISSAIIATRS